ncbi:MAG: chemotaxis protein CheX [Planctomycetes bacterium]|nr:chemotaxis protein CheX [Planctomycetota bacterium]
MQILQVDEHVVNVLVKATRDGLAMAGLKPVPVGVSRLINTRGAVSSIIGFVGPTSGSLMLNASKEGGCFMASKMLGEDMNDLTPQSLDGICEIANIIAGQTKAILSTSDYKFDRISVPSIVVGSSYFISHYKGMTTVCVEFELPEVITADMNSKIFSVSMCMMKI